MSSEPATEDMEALAEIRVLGKSYPLGHEAARAVLASDQYAALIEQAHAEGKAEADAAWVAKVEALADKWDELARRAGGRNDWKSAEIREWCADDLRALIPADAATALDEVRAQAKIEELGRLADEWDLTYNRGHDNSVHPYSHLLREHADRIGGACEPKLRPIV